MSPRRSRGCGAGSQLLPDVLGTERDRKTRDRFFERSCAREGWSAVTSSSPRFVERMPPMDTAALPIMPAADVSLIALFLQAHWVVKTVMLGLLACSVWVWAIAIDKIFLYARTRRAMDRFEQAFWSGQSIEELYRALSAKPTQSMAACFVAAMREWKRSFESHSRSIAGLQAR